MKNWIKGLIIMILGNILYEVIPVWVTEYLLSKPNPLYSIGTLLENLPSIHDMITGDVGFGIGILGFGMIVYGLYLFVKDLYERS